MPLQFREKVVKRLLSDCFRLFGVDYISGLKLPKTSNLTKIGTDYGGWVIPVDMLDSSSVCYCAGCGEDISFDLGLIERFACNVFAFDPTPRAIKYVDTVAGKNSNYHFQAVGLWDAEDQLRFYQPENPDHVSHSLLNLQQTKDYISVDVKRLSTLMTELGHQRIDLLKIDIEGAEYKVIESIIDDGLDITVICVEFDEYYHPLDANYRERIRSSITRLVDNGYLLVCAQGNGNYTFSKTKTLK